VVVVSTVGFVRSPLSVAAALSTKCDRRAALPCPG
jgi:hypothetical protein